eukprot:6867447-Karenia_brevis.AAC.1
MDRLCLHIGSSDRSDRELSTIGQQPRSRAFIDALVSAQVTLQGSWQLQQTRATSTLSTHNR